MNLEIVVYNKWVSPQFRKLIMLSIIGIIAGCLLNPLISELAYFIFGFSLSSLGCLIGMKRNIRKHITEADEAKISNNKLHTSANDSKVKLTLDKDSRLLHWIKLDNDKKIAVINLGIVACEVSEKSKNTDDSE